MAGMPMPPLETFVQGRCEIIPITPPQGVMTSNVAILRAPNSDFGLLVWAGVYYTTRIQILFVGQPTSHRCTVVCACCLKATDNFDELLADICTSKGIKTLMVRHGQAATHRWPTINTTESVTSQQRRKLPLIDWDRSSGVEQVG